MHTDKKFRLFTYLSFIPLAGFIIAFFGSQTIIHKEMRSWWYGALHYILVVLFSAAFVVLWIVFVTMFAMKLDVYWLYVTLALVSCYVLFLIISIISIVVAKVMLKRYNEKLIQ